MSSQNNGQLRSRTMLERMGFDDPDLKCPEHDRMSFALIDKAFCIRMFRSVLELTKEKIIEKAVRESYKKDTSNDTFVIKDNGMVVDILENIGSITPSCKCEIEYPLTKGEGQYRTIVGYLDCIGHVSFSVSYSCRVLKVIEKEKVFYDHRTEEQEARLHAITGPNSMFEHHKLNEKINEERRRVIPEKSEWVSTQTNGHYGHPFFVEAKPRLDNPMETLRQIKTYREFMEPGNAYDHSGLVTILWCPTISDLAKSAFVSEGIYVSTEAIPS